MMNATALAHHSLSEIHIYKQYTHYTVQNYNYFLSRLAK